MNYNKRIAVIGAGKMATAIISAIVKSGYDNALIFAYDVNPAATENFTKATTCATCSTMEKALEDADVVLLAVKPQFASIALKDAGAALSDKLLISIVAGMKLESLQLAAIYTDKIVRVMPNTPALVQHGMSCFTVSKTVNEEDKKFILDFLESFSIVREVPEYLLDAVTGLSGSGPAFVIDFILGLAEGGVYCGLPRELAIASAIQTVLGTAVMCSRNPSAIHDLRNAVITPNGTTARGIHVLNISGFQGIIENCVIAATERAVELGKK